MWKIPLFPLRLINKECSSHFRRGTADENKQFVNRASLRGGSLEITLTVPLLAIKI